MINDDIKVIERKIKQIIDEPEPRVMQFNWRVVWTFYKRGKFHSMGEKNFTNVNKTDYFIGLLRKKATLLDLGIVVDKINQRTGKKEKIDRGFRRKW